MAQFLRVKVPLFKLSGIPNGTARIKAFDNPVCLCYKKNKNDWVIAHKNAGMDKGRIHRSIDPCLGCS